MLKVLTESRSENLPTLSIYMQISSELFP